MKNNVKKLVAISFVVLSNIFFISCGKSSSSVNSNNGGTSANAVSIDNMAFSSSNIKVAAGTTVTWTNNDGVTHTVTADDDSFDSGNIASGATYSHTFSAAGAFTYHCSIHPMMTGKVTVQ